MNNNNNNNNGATRRQVELVNQLAHNLHGVAAAAYLQRSEVRTALESVKGAQRLIKELKFADQGRREAMLPAPGRYAVEYLNKGVRYYEIRVLANGRPMVTRCHWHTPAMNHIERGVFTRSVALMSTAQAARERYDADLAAGRTAYVAAWQLAA